MSYLRIFLILLLSGTGARAGILGPSFFVEPLAGYRSEIINLTDLTDTTTQITASAPNFGLKLGFRSVLGIDLNLAGEIMSGNAGVSSQSGDSAFTHKSAAVHIGVNSLGLIKMYLGTSLWNEFELKDTAALPGFKLSGPSFLAGLQLNFLPFLSLGLQYTLNQYDTIRGAAYASGSELDTYFKKVDTQDYSVYLSFPL